MKVLELKGTLRENVGKVSTKALRKNNELPCVIYGGEKTIHFSVFENEFRHLIFTPNAYLVKLSLGDNVVDAILQDVQYHPVTDRAYHVDFLQVSEDKPISIALPVVTTGSAVGVLEGGKMQLTYRRLKVKGLIKDLPETLEVDVTNIKLGSSIKVGELEYENLELLDSKNAVVASVKLTRAAKGDALEEGEEAEGEEAETSESDESAE